MPSDFNCNSPWYILVTVTYRTEIELCLIFLIIVASVYALLLSSF